jgi:hypothetical protein
MGDHRVIVWGKPYEVHTDKLSKSVWRCSGEYMDERHATQDRTEGAAIKRWREWATTKGG